MKHRLAAVATIHDVNRSRRDIRCATRGAWRASTAGQKLCQYYEQSRLLATTERIAAKLFSSRAAHDSARLVSESGLPTRADVVRLAKCGARAILVGEALMKHRDIQAGVRELIAD